MNRPQRWSPGSLNVHLRASGIKIKDHRKQEAPCWKYSCLWHGVLLRMSELSLFEESGDKSRRSLGIFRCFEEVAPC